MLKFFFVNLAYQVVCVAVGVVRQLFGQIAGLDGKGAAAAGRRADGRVQPEWGQMKMKREIATSHKSEKVRLCLCRRGNICSKSK
jgi:hypothetical protein